MSVHLLSLPILLILVLLLRLLLVNCDPPLPVFPAGPQPAQRMSEDMPETSRNNVRRYARKNAGKMSGRLRNNARKNVRQNVRRYARKKNVARNARRNVRKNARKNVRIEAARGELEASGRGSLHGRWEIWGVSLTMQSAIQQFAERLEMETTIGIYKYIYLII